MATMEGLSSPLPSSLLLNPPSVTHPSRTYNSNMITWLSSAAYFISGVGIIVILVLIAAILGYWYWTRFRGSYRYSQTTVRYSPLSPQGDQSESEVTTATAAGKRKKAKTKGLGHSIAHTHSPPRVSSGQWSSVPVSPHMDISAGHLLLAYIEDHLRNRNKLKEEWENLQSYAPEGVGVTVASLPQNVEKNRYPEAIPYDSNRVRLMVTSSNSDYINASFIVDTDPAHPKYIATQGPLQNTAAQFWQMVWEQNISVVVMLTSLIDMGLSQSFQYWPSSGVTTYRSNEVRLVSEHLHSRDYIIRSFYLQNTQARESRTVTHFQYLNWGSLGAPSTATPLLEFRRKVNKAHASTNTPLLVHCSGGVGRTGTYILIDMALSRIQSGAKEINLAATVEHLRDQRPYMVKTKPQFEFALSALVEETHAMLDAATQRTFH